jgi:hypothetical protein
MRIALSRKTAMKFTINVEATPEEARRFIGLPDIAPMQERMMKEMEDRMSENIRTLDPETFMKTWLPATITGWEEMQKLFWAQMGVGGAAPTSARQAAKEK